MQMAFPDDQTMTKEEKTTMQQLHYPMNSSPE
jgi:hypothetical protein